MLSGINGDINTYFYIHCSGMYTSPLNVLRHLVFTCPALCKEKLWYSSGEYINTRNSERTTGSRS